MHTLPNLGDVELPEHNLEVYKKLRNMSCEHLPDIGESKRGEGGAAHTSRQTRCRNSTQRYQLTKSFNPRLSL